MSTMEDSDSDLRILPVAEEKIRTFEDVPGPNGRPMAKIDGNIYYTERFTKTTIYYKCVYTKRGCRARAIMKSSNGTHRIELKHFHEYHEAEPETEDDGEGEYADGNEGEYEDKNDQSDRNYQENEKAVDDVDINSELDEKTPNSSPCSLSAVEQSPHAPESDIDSEMCVDIDQSTKEDDEGPPDLDGPYFHPGSDIESEMSVDIDPTNFLDQSTKEDDEGPPDLDGPYVHTHNTRKRGGSNNAQLNGRSSELSVQDLDESKIAEQGIGQSNGSLPKFNHEVHIFHESGYILHQCGLCETKYQLRSFLRKHLIVAHQIEPYTCSKCTKSFFRYSALKKHETDDHPQGTSTGNGDTKGELRFKCPHCVNTFTCASSVKSHVMLHFGIKPFRCTWDGCDKAYSQKSHLNQHLMVHSGERPYVCRVCNAAFRVSSHCRDHEKRKHELYEPRPRTDRRSGQNGQSSLQLE